MGFVKGFIAATSIVFALVLLSFGTLATQYTVSASCVCSDYNDGSTCTYVADGDCGSDIFVSSYPTDSIICPATPAPNDVICDDGCACSNPGSTRACGSGLGYETCDGCNWDATACFTCTAPDFACGASSCCTTGQNCVGGTCCTPVCPPANTVSCGLAISSSNGCGVCPGTGTFCGSGTCSGGSCVGGGACAPAGQTPNQDGYGGCCAGSPNVCNGVCSIVAPSNACAANTCQGNLCSDPCGNSYMGTMVCGGGGTACVTNCECGLTGSGGPPLQGQNPICNSANECDWASDPTMFCDNSLGWYFAYHSGSGGVVGDYCQWSCEPLCGDGIKTTGAGYWTPPDGIYTGIEICDEGINTGTPNGLCTDFHGSLQGNYVKCNLACTGPGGNNCCAPEGVSENVGGLGFGCCPGLTPDAGGICQASSIACYFDSQCDDLNVCTTNICVNPGTASSFCSNPVIAPVCPLASDVACGSPITPSNSCGTCAGYGSQCASGVCSGGAGGTCGGVACSANSDCTGDACNVAGVCNNPGVPSAWCSYSPAPPVDGGWGPWSACAGGIRTRVCDSPVPACGGNPCVGSSVDASSCPAVCTTNADCPGDACNINGVCDVVAGTCSYTTVAPVNGGWSAWGLCVAGSQSRTCTAPVPACGGAGCIGPSTQACTVTCSANADCSGDACNINGVCNDAGLPTSWCSYTPVAPVCPSANTVACGQAILSSNSCGACAGTGTMCSAGNNCVSNSCVPGIPGVCNVNADCNDGSACTTDVCLVPGTASCSNAPIAPINGGWSPWSTCVAGTQTRTCTNPAPACGGSACVGNSTQSCSFENTALLCSDGINNDGWQDALIDIADNNPSYTLGQSCNWCDTQACLGSGIPGVVNRNPVIQISLPNQTGYNFVAGDTVRPGDATNLRVDVDGSGLSRCWCSTCAPGYNWNASSNSCTTPLQDCSLTPAPSISSFTSTSSSWEEPSDVVLTLAGTANGNNPSFEIDTNGNNATYESVGSSSPRSALNLNLPVGSYTRYARITDQCLVAGVPVTRQANASVNFNVVPNGPPVNSLSATTTNGWLNFTANFSISVTDGDFPTSITLDFGDGSPAFSVSTTVPGTSNYNVLHTYVVPTPATTLARIAVLTSTDIYAQTNVTNLLVSGTSLPYVSGTPTGNQTYTNLTSQCNLAVDCAILGTNSVYHCVSPIACFPSNGTICIAPNSNVDRDQSPAACETTTSTCVAYNWTAAGDFSGALANPSCCGDDPDEFVNMGWSAGAPTAACCPLPNQCFSDAEGGAGSCRAYSATEICTNSIDNNCNGVLPADEVSCAAGGVIGTVWIDMGGGVYDIAQSGSLNPTVTLAGFTADIIGPQLLTGCNCNPTNAQVVSYTSSSGTVGGGTNIYNNLQTTCGPSCTASSSPSTHQFYAFTDVNALKPGVRTLSASLFGYTTESVVVNMQPGQNYRVDFVLTPRLCNDDCTNANGFCDSSCIGVGACQPSSAEASVLYACHPPGAPFGLKPGQQVIMDYNASNSSALVGMCCGFPGAGPVWQAAPKATVSANPTIGNIDTLVKFTTSVIIGGRPYRFVVTTW